MSYSVRLLDHSKWDTPHCYLVVIFLQLGSPTPSLTENSCFFFQLSVQTSYDSFILTKQIKANIISGGRDIQSWLSAFSQVVCLLKSTKNFNSLIATQGILQMRLYAMYSLNKRLLAMLIVCFVVSIGVSGHIMASIMSEVTSTSSLLATILNHVLNSDSGAIPFATWWNDLLSIESQTNILHGLDTLDCFRVLALWTCRVQRFADYEAQWINRSQAANHSYPGFDFLFLWVSRHVRLRSVPFDKPFDRICMTYGVCLMVAILTPVCFCTQPEQYCVTLCQQSSLLGVPIVFIISIPSVLSSRVVLNVRAAARDRESGNRSLSPIIFQ